MNLLNILTQWYSERETMRTLCHIISVIVSWPIIWRTIQILYKIDLFYQQSFFLLSLGLFKRLTFQFLQEWLNVRRKKKSQCLSIYICKVHKNSHSTRFGDVINIKVQLTYSCFSAHCPKISAMSGPKFRKFPVCHCVSFALHFTVLLQNYEQE